MGVRTVLLCHAGDRLNREGIAHWLAATTHLAGIVVIEEPTARLKKRIQREIRRIGFWRFLDVLAFRLYYKLFLAAADRAWEEKALEQLKRRFPEPGRIPELLFTPSPNSPETQVFLERLQPDLVIARCKTILAERIFRQPKRGTLVMHPGVCPEYRNAHGCFWALVHRDRQRVGMTLLQVDAGVDTGPVYGYYTYDFDEVNESHFVIQHRVVTENLDALAAKLREIAAGEAAHIDTTGRRSEAWGQPWMTKYLAWKAAARRSA